MIYRSVKVCSFSPIGHSVGAFISIFLAFEIKKYSNDQKASS